MLPLYVQLNLDLVRTVTGLIVTGHGPLAALRFYEFYESNILEFSDSSIEHHNLQEICNLTCTKDKLPSFLSLMSVVYDKTFTYENNKLEVGNGPI